MTNRTVRYRGQEYPVLDRFRVGGRTYLAITKLTSSGRRAYQVFDTSAKTMRALHVLPGGQATESRVRTLQRLTRGDNEILQILEVSRQGDDVWVVLPWIEGFNLRSVITGIRDRGQPRISTPEAVRLVKGLAHALNHVHQHKGIIHGDIKPANLLLTHRTSLVLIDYGSAWTVERTTTRSGGDGVSSGYAAPELARGDRFVDFRADHFSLCVVLYELLTDTLPYDGYGGQVGLIADAAKSGSMLVPPSRLSPERDRLSRAIWTKLDRLVCRGLAVDADDRFDTRNSWLRAWNELQAEVRQPSRLNGVTRGAIRVLDWIGERMNRGQSGSLF